MCNATLTDSCATSQLKRELDAVMSVAVGDMDNALAAVSAFEAALAEFACFSRCVTTSSETGTVSVMIGALDFQPGDEVIVSPDVSDWVISALLHAGIALALIDYAPDSLRLNLATLRKKVNSRTRAVLISSHFDCRQDFSALHDLCREQHLFSLLEITPLLTLNPQLPQRCAGFDMAFLSLREGSSAMSTGEGGAIFYRRQDWGTRAKSYSQFSDLDGIHLGVNHKLSGIQCALGQVRLNTLGLQRRAVQAQIDRAKTDCERVSVPQLPDLQNNSFSIVVIDKERATTCGISWQPLPILNRLLEPLFWQAPEAVKMQQKWAVMSLQEEAAQ
ncbi:DegT/DnrJ/EryC1/StrS aminotransferase family protein [Dickeya poaceiphila]|uniref:DegT/DnrJ/EryC1/StrS aminotransferase family protein n=2 Tax=Dickeya poaceiphila TaxID=568768 RepID=A0A5B8I9R4_9GAMM|nr:DegT/DnrJ/EryC1/StrS aminotransferase family protein [Dickeya poaceiphila]